MSNFFRGLNRHHLFSDLEYNYLCLADWADNVIDIREQFPLDRFETIQIAEEVGIRHSMDSETGTPIVMTTDFLLTIREEDKIRYVARTIKPSEDLNDERTIMKFEIERIYWERQGVDWAIVTEKEMPSTVLHNIKYLRDSYYIDIDYDKHYFLKIWSSFTGEILSNLKVFEENHNYDAGTGISILRHLLSRKILQFDQHVPINLHNDVSTIRINKNHVVRVD